VEPGDAVALEDSRFGAHAAVDAGIFTVWVPNAVTAQLPPDRYDARFASLADFTLRRLTDQVAHRDAG
jgi:beta-phosphoglucomutase-like phosphatase (HAD superfamily)